MTTTTHYTESALPPETGDSHDCPVCGTDVRRRHRPGRARVYCTNACRQRAYRWRRARGIRIFVERDGLAERSVNERRHALRDPADPVSRVTDHRGREVTVCGAYATPVRERRVTHDRFLPDHPWSCSTCVELTGGHEPDVELPEAVVRLDALLQSGLRAA